MAEINSVSYSIAVFAYNEERHIESCLRVIFQNVDERLHKVYLLANGCTDKTVEKAKALSEYADKLHVEVISLGDKCNAWNHYVHNIAQPNQVHFFVDADCLFNERCFPKMFDVINAAPVTTNIIAGMPLGGRNNAFYRSLVTERSCFFGNLYGMHPRYLAMIREKQFRLPVGLNWIDSFLTKAANTDINFFNYNLPQRVTYLDDAGFYFESLSPFKWSDIKLYKNRIARYELGKIQEKYLDAIPCSEWPSTMRPINEAIIQNFEAETKHLGVVKKALVKRRLSRLLASTIQ